MKISNLRLLTCLLLMVAGSFNLRADYSIHKLNDYREMVNQWNNAHNDWRFKDLENLYADKVLFYWSPVSKQACISDKENQVSPSKIYVQKIVSEIKVLKFGEQFIKCEFIKEVKIEDKVIQYPSYLILKEFQGDLKIVCEGDEITDANLNLKIDPTFLNQKAMTTESSAPGNKVSSPRTIYSISSVVLIIIIALAVRRRKRKADSNIHHKEGE